MNGGGIWTAATATLNMQGTNIVNDNRKPNGMRSNLFLKTGAVINITGDLADSHVSVGMETLGTFTSGYSTYHDVNPAGFFTVDKQSITGMKLVDGEGQLSSAIPTGGVYYVERSWNETTKRVEATFRMREENQYTTLTGGSDNTYLAPGWYVVKGSDVEYNNMLYMNGDGNNAGEYHLILCDGASLKAWFFIVNSPNVLHIYGQADDTGKMTNTYNTFFTVRRYYAGLGADDDAANGTIVIHGGDINVHGGIASPGIGNCHLKKAGDPITIYGGTVHAEGESESEKDGGGGGAGIGGGWHNDCGIVNIYGGSVYATGHGSKSGGAGIGSGSYADNSGTISIYGGYVEATGNEGGAGIGAGKGTNGADVTIHGGTVKAYAKAGGPGIGAGQNNDERIKYTGTLTVTGGKVYAYGSHRGAGIGGGWNTNGTNVTVSGGYVYAEGGKYAAGIGSGCEYITGGERHGGTLTVTGGYVEAHGGEDGAGIGGGEDADGGTINISGGEVRAYGSYGGAGIGGGEDGNGGKVTITGGTVIAQAGKNDTGYRAIGPGKGSDNYGSLTIGDEMMVSSERMANAVERKNMCWYRTQVRVEPCTHSSSDIVIVDGDDHRINCTYCTNHAAHTFGSNGRCNVCKLIRLEDGGDNSAVFSAWTDDQPHSFVLSGRKLTAAQDETGNWSDCAYTVCVPFDMDLVPYMDNLTLYTLSYIKDGKEMVFSKNAPYLFAGMPYLIVMHQGELELLSRDVMLTDTPSGNHVLDWDDHDRELGWWRGTFTKIDNDGASDMMAYVLQSAGDFRRITAETPEASLGAFRAMYCPNEMLMEADGLTPVNRLLIMKGVLFPGGDIDDYVTNFDPALFVGDADIPDGTTGISDAARLNGHKQIINSNWYSLDGRKLDGIPTAKGVYINSGRKVVIE